MKVKVSLMNEGLGTMEVPFGRSAVRIRYYEQGTSLGRVYCIDWSRWSEKGDCECESKKFVVYVRRRMVLSPWL